MYRIRAASLCFVVALSFAVLPAHAQGPANNLNAINTRLIALEATVAALQNALNAESSGMSLRLLKFSGGSVDDYAICRSS